MNPVRPLTAYQASVAAAMVAGRVEFLVIGAMAMQAHGLKRETSDLDLWVSRSRANAERVLAALARLYAVPNPDLTIDVLQSPKRVIWLPDAENKEVDILTSIGALDFDLSARKSFAARFGALELRVLGLDEMVYTKFETAASPENGPDYRARHHADARELIALWQERNRPSIGTGSADRPE